MSMDKKNKHYGKTFAYGLSLILLGQSSYALELDTQLDVGTDSNPLELADQFSPDSSTFTQFDLRLRQELNENFRVSGKLNTQIFFDQEEADNTNLSTRLDYKLKSQLADRDVSYRFDVEYNQVDRTYVSKNLGRVGETTAGVPVADRYDSNWLDYRARMDLDLNAQLRLDLNLTGRDKSYDDFTALGLSNLDYSQWFFEPNLRFDASKHSLFSVSFALGKRDFDDRNGRDLLTGSFIPDTQLEYDYQGAEIQWRFRPDEQQQYRLVFQHEKREDSVSGYFDSTNNVLRLAYRNQFTDSQRIELGLRYKDYSYDNSLDQGSLETEEAILSKDGFAFSAEYTYQLAGFTQADVWAVVKLGYDSFDSVVDVYAYDKSVISIGLQYGYLFE